MRLSNRKETKAIPGNLLFFRSIIFFINFLYSQLGNALFKVKVYSLEL